MENNNSEDLKNKVIIEKKEINGKENIIDRYYVGAFIGKGGFGKVYEFKSENDGIIYAGKIIDKDIFKEKSDNEKEIINVQKNKQNIQAETKIQQELKSPRIVKVKTFFEDDDNVYIVLEKCSSTLQDLLDELLKQKKYLTEIEIQYFMFQLIQGLKYLHDKNIIHRDLKPVNLFLNDKLELKIGDFGLVVKLYNRNEKITDFGGTLKYMAPEILIKPIKGYSFSVDIWAFGIIMYQLFTGTFPFFNDNQILKSDVSFPNDIKMSKAAKDLIKQILEKDPIKRPNLTQILYHDFFHICKFPKFLEIKPPDNSLFKKYNPDLDENDIINKDVEIKLLYKIKAPGISDVNYEDIDNYTLKSQSELEGFKNYIDYFHKSSHLNFYYYEVNNGLFGTIFEDGINLLIDSKNQTFYNIINKIDKNKKKKTEIKSYNYENCPETLKEKLDTLLNYNKRRKATLNNSDNKEKEIKDNDEKEKKEDEIEEFNLFYIKKVKEQNKAYFLKLSDRSEQIIFKERDKVQIVLSREKPNILYIEKNKEITIIQKFNILNNSSEEVTDKMKYIKKYSILEIKEKMAIKNRELNHEHHDNKKDNEEKIYFN